MADKHGLQNGPHTTADPGHSSGLKTPLYRSDAKAILGCRLKNRQDEELGKVDDLMVNIQTGEVEYVVVEFGKFLGLGGKLFAIPFKELQAGTDNKTLTIDRDKEYLVKSPGFDKTHWPDTNDHSYFNNVTLYYGSYLPPFP